MNAVLTTWTVLALVAAPAALPAAARPQAVCVVGDGAEGLEPEAVQAALLLEGRLRGAGLAVQLAPSLAGCGRAGGPEPVELLLGPGARALLVRPLLVRPLDRRELALDVTSVRPAERAPELARAVLGALLDAPLPEAAAPLVDVDSPLPLPPPRPLDAPLALLLWLTGGHDGAAGEGPGRGWGGAELGGALGRGRLTAGLAAAWALPTTTTAGDATGTLRRGELLAIVRAGLRLGRARLQLGLGAGYEWRWLTVRSPHRFAALADDSGTAVLLLEPLLLWPVGEKVLLGLAAPLRGYPSQEDYVWQQESLLRAPRRTAGLSVRLGVGF